MCWKTGIIVGHHHHFQLSNELYKSSQWEGWGRVKIVFFKFLTKLGGKVQIHFVLQRIIVFLGSFNTEPILSHPTSQIPSLSPISTTCLLIILSLPTSLSLSSVCPFQISKPQLGETIPGHVHCTIEVDVSRFVGEIREEWESLRDHDGTIGTVHADPCPSSRPRTFF